MLPPTLLLPPPPELFRLRIFISSVKRIIFCLFVIDKSDDTNTSYVVLLISCCCCVVTKYLKYPNSYRDINYFIISLLRFFFNGTLLRFSTTEIIYEIYEGNMNCIRDAQKLICITNRNRLRSLFNKDFNKKMI